MKVLITGSQGFIGSYLCQELLNNGYEVWGIDNFSKYGKVSRPHDNHPNFHFTEADVQSKEKWDVEFDYIIAIAAMIGGISFFHKFAYDLIPENNSILDATFRWALYQQKSLKRLIMLSSSMVYEGTDSYPTLEDDIKTCRIPDSTYGFQKLMCEYYCKGAWEQYQLPYTIIRPFNCVGIGEEEAIAEGETKVGNEKMMLSHVLPDLISRAMKLDPSDFLPILGQGNQIRHYTNGKDIARGIRIAMESEKAINNDFNISTGQSTSVKELAETVWEVIHGCQLRGFKNLIPFEHDVQKRVPSTEKAKEILGFEAKISLKQSVEEVYSWMKEKKND